MKRMNKIDLINQFFVGKNYNEDTKTQIIRILSEKKMIGIGLVLLIFLNNLTN